jgi:hypothetical protein
MPRTRPKNVSPYSLPATILLAAAACTSAAAAQPAIRDAPGKAAGCALRVDFGSYAMGIDRGAAAAVEKAILLSRGVGDIARHRWGREGEYTLCVVMRSPRAAAVLFDRLKPLLPPKPRGPIALSLADGRTVRAPAR